jgi:hypothetical protein
LTHPEVRPVPELIRGGVRLVPPVVPQPAVGAHEALPRGADVAPAPLAARAGSGDAPAAAAAQEGSGPAFVAEERQELSAAATAAAVQSGLADVGVGVEPAATALGLDFVALRREDLTLVLRPDFVRSDAGRALLDAARGKAFATAVKRLAGYESAHDGSVERGS